MERTLTFKSASEEAAYYKQEIDKFFRAMDRSEKRRQKIRAESERLKAETRAMLERIEAS